jgi:putative colanic acid biosynthesis UDP-glucose lipid carrier transferase
VPVSGDLSALVEAAKSGKIDQILIALPQGATRRIREVARRFEALPVDVHVCTHVATEFPGRSLEGYRISMIGAVGMLQLRQKPIRDWSAMLKRAEDVVIGSLILLVAAPVMLVAAAAIKLDSTGPVFFRQRRMGLNNETINVWKFRSMSVMENSATVRQAERNDPRVTRVGRFLRRSSIDELPQLFNVLMGEMSLVGPRPHALAHDDLFGRIIARYANRHQVKPGMTGLAQVSGYRGETREPRMMQKRVQHDLWYIENWSFLLDLKIILMTPFACLVDKKAY